MYIVSITDKVSVWIVFVICKMMLMHFHVRYFIWINLQLMLNIRPKTHLTEIYFYHLTLRHCINKTGLMNWVHRWAIFKIQDNVQDGSQLQGLKMSDLSLQLFDRFGVFSCIFPASGFIGSILGEMWSLYLGDIWIIKYIWYTSMKIIMAGLHRKILTDWNNLGPFY